MAEFKSKATEDETEAGDDEPLTVEECFDVLDDVLNRTPGADNELLLALSCIGRRIVGNQSRIADALETIASAVQPSQGGFPPRFRIQEAKTK